MSSLKLTQTNLKLKLKEFILDEAEVSGDEASSDESDTSDTASAISAFICDDEVPTSDEQTSHYLRTSRVPSPSRYRSVKKKIVKRRVHKKVVTPTKEVVKPTRVQPFRHTYLQVQRGSLFVPPSQQHLRFDFHLPAPPPRASSSKQSKPGRKPARKCRASTSRPASRP
ncbi:hypothetical protein V8E36_000373 [Tilletia maclaganii]